MSNQQRLVPILAAAVGYVVKFTACSFLTPALLMTFGALVAAYLILVGPEVPFLQYLSFVLPIDARGNATLNEDDILRVYGLITMAFFVLSVAGEWLFRLLKRAARRVFQPDAEAELDGNDTPANQNLFARGKRRLLITSIVITVIYLAVFVAIPSARMAEGASPLVLYPIFILFYAIAMVLNAIYIGMDSLSDLVLWWGWSRLLSGWNTA